MRIRWAAKTDRGTIIGVVGDVRQAALGVSAKPEIYAVAQNFGQIRRLGSTLVVRGDGPPERLVGAIRAAIGEVSPGQALFRVATMEEVIEESLATPRLYAWLVGLFAAMGTLLAIAGIYGVIAYLVTLRTREFGIRMALGADTGRMLRLVMSRGAWLTALGLAIGIGGAAALTRVLRGVLYGVAATDSVTFGAVAAVLARRGTRCVPGARAAGGTRRSVGCAALRVVPHASGSGGFRKVAGAVGRAPPLRLALADGLGQGAAYAGSIEIGAVNRGAGLLAPGLREGAGIHAVESELVQELDHDALGPFVVARHGQCIAPRAAGRAAEIHQVLGIDIIERLDHGPAQLLLDPLAFGDPVLDFVDAAIAFARIVITGVDDHHVAGDAGKQVFRQIADLRLGNRDHHHTAGAGRFGGRDRFRPGLFHQPGERLGSSRVGHEHFVAEGCQPRA